jgi:hypothetical protein
MRFFATIFFRDIEAGSGHYQLLKKLDFFPEVYFESGWARLGEPAHKQLAAKVKGDFAGCSVHLPYGGILPGSGKAEDADMMKRAASLAALYSPRHMIGHANFRPQSDSVRAPLKSAPKTGPLDSLEQTPGEGFLKNSASFWTGAIESCGGWLFLENTKDYSPFAIQALLRELPPERASMCLDVGHWHCSGQGSKLRNLDQWVEMCAPRLGHLHLHDNHGAFDEHLGLGGGAIDFGLLKALLREHSLSPTATLENQTEDELKVSAERLKASPF